jgi:uncharacterized protein YkvS
MGTFLVNSVLVTEGGVSIPIIVQDLCRLQDISGKVDKVNGKSLISDIAIARLENTSGTNTGDQDISGKVDKVNNKSLILDTAIDRLENTSGTNTGDQDISGKADKVNGKSLISDTAIARLENTSGTNTGDQDISGKVDKVNNKSLILDTAITRLENTSGVNTGDQDLSGLQLRSEKDLQNGYAGLDNDGKISPLQLPALAITSTFVVNSQSEMLALAAEEGDVAIRTDLSKTLILSANNASVLANWKELRTPTDAVQSVFGRSGAITPQNNDYSTSQIQETAEKVFVSPQEKSAVTHANREALNEVLNVNTGDETLETIQQKLVSTTNLSEGVNLYFTVARVLAAVLAGISFATNRAVVATDTVLQAIGFLQKQITDALAAIALKAPLESPTFTGVVTASKYNYTLGANASIGNATLGANGTVTISTTAATANSFVSLGRKSNAGTVGNDITYTVTNGSLTITSDVGLDRSTITYIIYN